MAPLDSRTRATAGPPNTDAPRHLPRVLGISLDQALADPASALLGDTRHHATGLSRAVSEIHFVVYTPTPRPPFKLAQNVWVYPTASSLKPLFLRDALRLGSELCQKREIEVVYTQDLYATGLVGSWLKKRFGIGLCCLIAGDMIGNTEWLRESPLHRLWDRVARRLIHRCDAIRVASSTEIEKLVRLGVPRERIWKLGWFIDLERFAEADGASVRDQLLRETGGSALVVSVGRLVQQKDYPTLLRAMRLVVDTLPCAILGIVGDGPERSALEALVNELELQDHVRFVGAVAHSEIPRFFAAADVFALSSVYEGNARVLAEAAAAGKPIVATETSGTRDSVLDGESGYVLQQKDATMFAQRLVELLSDPSKRTGMGRQGQQHAFREFGDQTLLRGFRAMFASLQR